MASAIETVNNFAETLRNNELVHDVSIESFPLDISSDSTLQGDAKKAFPCFLEDKLVVAVCGFISERRICLEKKV